MGNSATTVQMAEAQILFAATTPHEPLIVGLDMRVLSNVKPVFSFQMETGVVNQTALAFDCDLHSGAN